MMEDHTHGVKAPAPGDPPPPGYELAPAPTAPKLKLSAELKPAQPDLPPPTDAPPPKPSDEEAGIDNTLHSAAISAVRRGKPLQKGLNPEK